MDLPLPVFLLDGKDPDVVVLRRVVAHLDLLQRLLGAASRTNIRREEQVTVRKPPVLLTLRADPTTVPLFVLACGHGAIGCGLQYRSHLPLRGLRGLRGHRRCLRCQQ